jgi:hypothetical protein
MNRYGQIALERMRRYQPEVLAGIEDPDSYFSSLGEDLERQITELAAAIAGPDRPGEDYLVKLARLREARITAESEILRQVGAPLEQEDPAEAWPREPAWTPIGAPLELSEDELLVVAEREADRRQQA